MELDPQGELPTKHLVAGPQSMGLGSIGAAALWAPNLQGQE